MPDHVLARQRLQWLKNLFTADDVKDQIYKLSRKGLTPSKIGESFASGTTHPCP